MDLRFADFVEGVKPELTQLKSAADVRMLETSATGKTSTIFDYGRTEGNYLIYIRCAEPETETNEGQPMEFAKQPERIFPAVIRMIEGHANTTKRVQFDVAREYATCFILADLCARMCFLLWYRTRATNPTPEKFLVAQLGGGQDF
jgi:hypothetical protein